MSLRRRIFATVSVPVLAASGLLPDAAWGQAASAPASASEQVIVTGTRDPHQTASKSLSPIAVVTASQLRATGEPDLRDALTHLAPSVTREVLNGGNANFLDTIALRTLSQDETLILVNGKRRHTTSVINDTGAQLGSTPVDIGMIPISSIDHIEILQDGAAAQYGSDAIAGVVNIILKKNASGFDAQGTAGGYYKGDGFTTDDSAGGGIALGTRGYLNLNIEFKHQDNTSRGGPDDRLGTRVDQFFGSPQETRETIEYDAGYDVTDHISLYSFATYGHRNGESWQYYRVPSLLPAIYPAGFDPVSAISEDDYSVTLGARDTIAKWNLDFSSTYGGDNSALSLFNSANTALYAATGATPTSFNQMSFADADWTNDFGIQRAFDVPLLASPLNFSIGAQYRYDTYDVRPGDPASYYGSGPQGQAGLSPLSQSSSGRDVTAGYIDVSAHITPKWQVDLAGRFEHYTDAGDTETGKVSTRYDFNKYVAVRGTASNGFRAPTLAEEHYTSLQTTPTGASGILAVDSAAARSLGAAPLKPEHSTNFSAGLVLHPVERMAVTVDAYRINIRDRITLGGVYEGQPALDALASQGIVLASTVSPADVSAQYFANAASTYTTGLDVAATYTTPLGDRYGRIDWDAAFNANSTYVKRIGNDQNGNALLNLQDVAYLSTYFPHNKLIIGGHWYGKRWDFALHEIRYGNAISQLTYVSGPNEYSNTVFDEFVNQPRYETDVAIGYKITRQIHLTLGANNVFNAYPSRIPADTAYLGVDRSDKGIEQIGINGGYYYLAANISY